MQNFASIQYFSHHFASQFHFGWKKKHYYRIFLLRFCFASIFCLIFAYFTFVFALDFWCFASKWIMWNQAYFSLPSEKNEIFASISNFASEVKVRAHPSSYTFTTAYHPHNNQRSPPTHCKIFLASLCSWNGSKTVHFLFSIFVSHKIKPKFIDL